MTKNYRQIEHTADIAIEVTGGDLKSLFINCAYALFDMLYQTSAVKGLISYKIKADGDTKEELLINFLRELFFKFAVYKVLLKDIKIVNLSDNEITADVTGEKYEEGRHRLKSDIKAVTYHNVKIEKKRNKLKVSITFDT
jgi:SHS2 domain-containing protein